MVDEKSPKHRENCINDFLGLRYHSSEDKHWKKMHETACSLQTPPSTTTYPSDSHVPSQMEINQQNLRKPVTLIHPLARKTRRIFATLFNRRFLPTLALGYRCFCLKIPCLTFETWTPGRSLIKKTRRFPNRRMMPDFDWLGCLTGMSVEMVFVPPNNFPCNLKHGGCKTTFLENKCSVLGDIRSLSGV